MVTVDQTQRNATIEDDREYINLSDWWRFFRAHRAAYALTFVVSTAIGVAVALVVPKVYTPRVTILPSQPASPASGLLSRIGGGALIPGFSAGQPTVALYPEIGRSTTVLTAALDLPRGEGTYRSTLMGIYRIKGDSLDAEEELLRTIRKKLDIKVDPATNFMSVAFTAHNPRLAANFVNQIVRQMDRFLDERMRTEVDYRLQMIQGRLAEEKGALRKAEDKLLRFRENNRAATLSPAALTQQARLEREVTIHSTLYIELMRQREIALIEKHRTAPVLTVLDWAVPPVKKSGPKRSLIIIGIIAFAMAAMTVPLKVRENRKRRSHPPGVPTNGRVG